MKHLTNLGREMLRWNFLRGFSTRISLRAKTYPKSEDDHYFRSLPVEARTSLGKLVGNILKEDAPPSVPHMVKFSEFSSANFLENQNSEEHLTKISTRAKDLSFSDLLGVLNSFSSWSSCGSPHSEQVYFVTHFDGE